MTELKGEELAAAVEEAAPEIAARKAQLEQERLYDNEYWLQQLMTVRTRCFRCDTDSPTIFIAIPQKKAPVMEFGRRVRSDEQDVSLDAQDKFSKMGWVFNDHRSYCPTCKGLGS